MARRNSKFVNQKLIIGNKSIQASDLTDSARESLGPDSDFVKDVLFKLDSNFVNLGFGLDGASIRDSSLTQDKFADEVVAALLSGLDSGQTVSLIYPGGEVYQSTVYTPNTDTNTYSPGTATNGAFVYVQGAGGGGGAGRNRGFYGGGGGGAGGGFFKMTRAQLDATNIVQVGAKGNAGNPQNGNHPLPGNAGGVTKLSTGNASYIQVNGGAGGGIAAYNSNGATGGAGGTVNHNLAVVDMFEFSGNSGANRYGGNASRTLLTSMDVGAACGLFRVAVFNDTAANDIIDDVDGLPTGSGGNGGLNASYGSNGTDGRIVIFEFK